jgi:hypothetical protein
LTYNDVLLMLGVAFALALLMIPLVRSFRSAMAH